MKVLIPASQKPRAKWLNDLLLSKKAARHADPRNPSRRDQKKELQQVLKEFSF